MRHILLLVIGFSITLLTYSQSVSPAQFKNKKVEYTPKTYQLPTNPLTAYNVKSNQLWIVYSDRNDNNVYSDINCSKIISKANFLDSFFVTKVSGEMLELIKFNSIIINISGQIIHPEKVEYAGWMDKSNLLLNERSFIDPITQYPYKYATLINGTKIFPTTLTYLNGSLIKVYSDPELKNASQNQILTLNEVVYVYKKHKDHVLIGNKNHISTKNASKNMIGWTHVSFIQQWSTRLSLEYTQSKDLDTISSYLFPAKNHAINFENNALTAIPLKPQNCNANNFFWNKLPVYNIESTSKNNKNYMLIETGAIIQPFDNSQAYIYSSNGSKINYSTVCSILQESKKINIVFALNLSEDLKEYYTSLIETFHEIDTYFSVQKYGNYTFSLLNTADNTYTKITTVENFNLLLPKVIDMIKENVQFKKESSPNGILNGLTAAASHFKDHAGENNILMLLSSKGDNAAGDNIYKTKFDKTIIDLANSDAKVIMYQPYSLSNITYTNFITQAKNILKKYADKTITSRNSIKISSIETSYPNTFKSLEAGKNNIYCLDFPQQASSQGYVIFPTIGSKVDKEAISITFDSLFYNIKYDKKNTLNNIQSAFNSASIFNTKTNPYFERYYNMFNMLPRNLEIECKNINFDYFARGYTISPYEPNNSKKYYKQNLLLTEEEYQELCILFKSLKIDILLIEPTDLNKQQTEYVINNTLNKRLSITSRRYVEATLKDFLFETCGYYTTTPLLNKCMINDMFSSSSITKDDYFIMLTRLKKSFDSFYQIQENPNYSFYSNETKYYWINETLLP